MKNTRTVVLITWIVILFTQNIAAQKSDALLNHYKNEFQTFKEFVERSKAVKGDTTIDIKFYYIDIEVGINSPYIKGSVLTHFEPKAADLNNLFIDLNSALQVDSISYPCESFLQAGDAIQITLANTYDPGDIVELTIYYQGVPVMAGGYKGMRYESHGNNERIIATLSTPYLAHYWYPCKDGPQDKPDSVFMDITIPDTVVNGVAMMGVSNGVLENIITSNNKKTFQWRHRYPIVTYYVMAAISNYVHFQDEFNGTGGESFPLDYYVFENDLNIAQQGVEQLPEAIQVFSDLFGTYPFSNEKYGMTQLGFYSAIENQTNTIQNTLSLSWFDVSVHELGHMWFGDMITLADWHHCWLNEGFATYSEALWDEHLYGFTGYKNNIATNEFWGGGTLYLENDLDTFNTFQNIFYSKGAYVVHMLRRVLGDDLFFDALLDYSQNPDFMYKNATTADLQTSFENSSGMELDFFFEQWVYDEYFPLYLYNFAQNSNNILYLAIYQAQEELFGHRPVFEMPVRVRINFQNGSDTTVTVWNDQQTQNYSFVLDNEITSVLIDPDKWILRKQEYNPDLPVGISDDMFSEGCKIYPNPSTGVLFISVEAIEQKLPYSLYIYDNSGKLVLEKTIKHQGITQVSTNDIEPGIYFFSLQNEKIVLDSGKLLIH